jgi:hypothetical protein
MKDNERLEFIKQKINYLGRKRMKVKGSNKFIDDLIWLVEKAEKTILKSRK